MFVCLYYVLEHRVCTYSAAFLHARARAHRPAAPRQSSAVCVADNTTTASAPAVFTLGLCLWLWRAVLSAVLITCYVLIIFVCMYVCCWRSPREVCEVCVQNISRRARSGSGGVCVEQRTGGGGRSRGIYLYF